MQLLAFVLAILFIGVVIFAAGFVVGARLAQKYLEEEHTNLSVFREPVLPEVIPDIRPLTEIEEYEMVTGERPDGAVFGVIYINRNSEVTQRVIMPSVIEDENHFSAYCYLRREYRHFRVDRCLKFFDPFTGETFDDFGEASAAGVGIRETWMKRRKEFRRDKRFDVS